MFFLALLAALPPLAQSSKEIQAILSSPEIANYLECAERIESIKRTDEGYVIETNYQKLEVHIHYVEAENMVPGPQQYEIEFITS